MTVCKWKEKQSNLSCCVKEKMIPFDLSLWIADRRTKELKGSRAAIKLIFYWMFSQILIKSKIFATQHPYLDQQTHRFYIVVTWKVNENLLKSFLSCQKYISFRIKSKKQLLFQEIANASIITKNPLLTQSHSY